MTLFDSGNNRRLIGGDSIFVTISNGITDIEVFDEQDGSQTVKYLINDASLTHTVEVTVNGDTSNTKSSVITTVPNKPSSVSSTLVTTQLIDLETSYDVDSEIFDAFGNKIIVN